MVHNARRRQQNTRIIALQEIEFNHEIYFIELYRII